MLKFLICYKYSKIFIFLLFISLLLQSCITTKKPTLYFADLPKDTTLHNFMIKNYELRIIKGDVLNIGVSSLSAENSGLFTAPQIAGVAEGGGTGPGASTGFLVDINGNILYPKLGFVRVEGMTRDELRNQLLKDLTPYLKEPVVTVAFVNHKITILGDVGRPQVLPMPGETMTILDAIGFSGELSKTSKETNILVIRDTGMDKQFKRLNLKNSSVFYSPFYYLKPNDIVYVEQDPLKMDRTNNSQQVFSYISTGLSLIFLILSRIK